MKTNTYSFDHKFPSNILFLLLVVIIGFYGIFSISSQQYSSSNPYLDISAYANKLTLIFSEDESLKAKISLKIARENLESLRAINITDEIDQKKLTEVLNQTEENLLYTTDLIYKIKNGFGTNKSSVASSNLFEFLQEFDNISATSYDLLNRLQPQVTDVSINSRIEELKNKYNTQSIITESNIEDLLDDKKLNFSDIMALDIEFVGLLEKNGNDFQIRSGDIIYNLSSKTSFDNNLIDKNVRIKGILERYPFVVSVLEVKESPIKKDRENIDAININLFSTELKGIIKIFGNNFVFVSLDEKNKYLLANTPADTLYLTDKEVLLSGILNGNVFEVGNIIEIETEQLDVNQ